MPFAGYKKVKKVCSNNLTAEGIVRQNDPFLWGDDCDIIGLNQRKAHKHWEFRWFSPNLSMQD